MAKIEPVHILGVAIGNYTNLDEGDENGVLWGFKTNDVCRRIFPKELIKYLDEYSHLSPLSISVYQRDVTGIPVYFLLQKNSLWVSFAPSFVLNRWFIGSYACRRNF